MQGAARILAAEFIDGSPFEILEAASLPVQPEGPQRLEMAGMGLMFGVLAGALAALFTKLRVWILALALGIVGAAATFIVPEQYTSTALVRYDGPDGWSGMRELIGPVTSDYSLLGVAIDSGLAAANPRASIKFREHLLNSADSRAGRKGSSHFVC